jgi:flagellar hook-associated protein 3 FlgL
MTIRVTDSYMSSILVGDLNRSLGRLLEQQLMAGSMRRVNSFADDPRSVSTIQRYNALIANNDEYLSNVTRSRILVDGTDAALQNISEVLADARVIALREASAIATPQSQEISVVEVDNLINRMMDVLNTSIEGNYLFSGQQVKTPPFVRSGSTVLYQGDTEDVTSRTGPNSTMAVNIPGDIFLGSQSSTLGGLRDMSPRLLLTSNLSDTNLGAGWSPGSISISDGTGSTYQVDLTGAVTVDDAINTINAATGGSIVVGLNAEGSGFEFTGIGPLVIGEINGGSTAATLGINATSQGGTLTGRDIRENALLTTNLADVESINGSLPLGMMNINWQGTDYSIDFSAAATIGDIQTIFNGAIPGMEIQLQNNSFVLIGGSPEAFIVTNGDATNTASTLGLNGTGTPVRLFGMLEDLKTALLSGNKTAIRAGMSELSSLEDTIYQLLMKNGGRQNDLDWSESILRQRDERLRSNLSLEYDADVAQVAADLSHAETSYQASLLVTSKLYSANLMQFLS